MSPGARGRLAPMAAGWRKFVGYFPIRPLGGVVAVGSIVLIRSFAIDQDDLVAAVLGWIGLSTLGVACVVVVLGLVLTRAALEKRLTGGELRFDTEAEIPTGFALPSLGYLPLVQVDVEVEQRGLSSRTEVADLRLREHLSASRRALHGSLVRRVRIGDAFGLVRVDFVIEESRGVVVEPHLGRLAELPTLFSLASGDAVAHPTGDFQGDRVDVRRYAAGDPARHIHWPVLARTRKLVVRVQERAIAPSERVVAYVVAGPADEASAAAALAAVRHGALGPDWSLGADGSARAVRDVESAAIAIVGSSEYEADGGRDLEDFLRAAEADGPVGLVLFVPPRLGLWTERVLAVLKSRSRAAHVVVGIDELAPRVAPSRLARLARVLPDARGVAADELDLLRARLADVHARVTIVHRPSGRVLADGANTALDLEAA